MDTDAASVKVVDASSWLSLGPVGPRACGHYFCLVVLVPVSLSQASKIVAYIGVTKPTRPGSGDYLI